MGLFDQLKSAAIGAAATAAPALLSKALQQTDFGSLQGLVDHLRQGGLDQQVQSWLSNGANLPVSTEQLRAALGDEHVRQLAQQSGLPIDKILELMSQHLPDVVDQASPNGRIQEPPSS
jgi:uncharacterized protein YidB (DUF937 family)